MSVIALFGSITFPVAISVMALVTRLVAISVLALCGPWFLFLFRAVPNLPPPHGAAVSSVGVMVQVTVREDGFLITISHQGLPNTMCIKIWRWHTKCGGHNLTLTGWYEQWKERQALGHIGRV